MKYDMTHKQLEIAKLVIAGWDNQSIAEKQKSSLVAVKRIIQRTCKEHGCKTRTEFVSKFFLELFPTVDYSKFDKNELKKLSLHIHDY